MQQVTLTPVSCHFLDSQDNQSHVPLYVQRCLNYESHVPVPFEPFLLMLLPHLRHLTTFLRPSVLDPATGSQVRLIGNPLGRKFRTPLVQTPQTRTACPSHIFWMKRVFSRCEGVPCPFNKFSPSLQSSVVIKPKAEHRWQLWHSISSHVLILRWTPNDCGSSMVGPVNFVLRGSCYCCYQVPGLCSLCSLHTCTNCAVLETWAACAN